MAREAWVWCGLAALSLGWCAMVVSTGGSLLIPVLAAGLCAICGADAPARHRVSRVLGKAFSGPAWRTALIVIGAMLLVQALPYELALLVAGDALVYMETLAAVGLIAARTRLRPLAALACERVRLWCAPILRSRAAPRTVRLARPARRRPSAEDAEGRGFAFG